MDCIKDRIHYLEECGDAFWYLALDYLALGYEEFGAKAEKTYTMEAPAQIEILDMVKKHLFYKRPIDKDKVLFMLNDLYSSLELGLKGEGFTIEQCWDINDKKLDARYKGLTFSAENAINRDLDNERKVLEG